MNKVCVCVFHTGFNSGVYSDLLVVSVGRTIRKVSEAVSEFSQKV